eukprot:MONOS_898.1-p1 / transcript=MONOS_898.1 / gene=MONOS_898 / organism=Monocercomonoides_exilis_PA203 / gene_product=unspecified product / transcript_product=unspecified product / location=Mono_scaffold00015:32461-34012(+) / protein_length=460 / sequence_SO=supercontig / SO=protein_coding / is_pseudo=false
MNNNEIVRYPEDLVTISNFIPLHIRLNSSTEPLTPSTVPFEEILYFLLPNFKLKDGLPCFKAKKISGQYSVVEIQKPSLAKRIVKIPPPLILPPISPQSSSSLYSPKIPSSSDSQRSPKNQITPKTPKNTFSGFFHSPAKSRQAEVSSDNPFPMSSKPAPPMPPISPCSAIASSQPSFSSTSSEGSIPIVTQKGVSKHTLPAFDQHSELFKCEKKAAEKAKIVRIYSPADMEVGVLYHVAFTPIELKKERRGVVSIFNLEAFWEEKERKIGDEENEKISGLQSNGREMKERKEMKCFKNSDSFEDPGIQQKCDEEIIIGEDSNEFEENDDEKKKREEEERRLFEEVNRREEKEMKRRKREMEKRSEYLMEKFANAAKELEEDEEDCYEGHKEKETVCGKDLKDKEQQTEGDSYSLLQIPQLMSKVPVQLVSSSTQTDLVDIDFPKAKSDVAIDSSTIFH